MQENSNKKSSQQPDIDYPDLASQVRQHEQPEKESAHKPARPQSPEYLEVSYKPDYPKQGIMAFCVAIGTVLCMILALFSLQGRLNDANIRMGELKELNQKTQKAQKELVPLQAQVDALPSLKELNNQSRQALLGKTITILSQQTQALSPDLSKEQTQKLQAINALLREVHSQLQKK